MEPSLLKTSSTMTVEVGVGAVVGAEAVEVHIGAKMETIGGTISSEITTTEGEVVTTGSVRGDREVVAVGGTTEGEVTPLVSRRQAYQRLISLAKM